MVKFLWRGHLINESVSTPCIAPHDLVNLKGEHIPLGFPVFHNQWAIRMGVACAARAGRSVTSAAARPARRIRARTCTSSMQPSSPAR
jgi:hypothetical protein